MATLSQDNSEVNELEGGHSSSFLKAFFLRVLSSTRQVASVALSLISSVCPLTLAAPYRQKSGRKWTNFPARSDLAMERWLSRAPGSLPMATAFHNTSPTTVEKNSLKPICGIACYRYQSSIMDIKLNKNTNKDNKDFFEQILNV